ncbi:MAG: FHA domain-containing protein, partial [Acidimicrobiia bacterium]
MENDEQERRDPAGEPDDEDEVETDTTISYEPVAEERRERGREAAAAVTGLKGFALVVARGPRRGLHWLLAEGATEAGRSTKADIFLDDITVSRRHARFTVEEGRLRVEDLGS